MARRREPSPGELGEDPKALSHRLAASVRAARKRLKLSQEEAAHRCGMSTRALSKVETAVGDAKLTTLQKLCRGLGITDPRKLLAPIARGLRS